MDSGELIVGGALAIVAYMWYTKKQAAAAASAGTVTASAASSSPAASSGCTSCKKIAAYAMIPSAATLPARVSLSPHIIAELSGGGNVS